MAVPSDFGILQGVHGNVLVIDGYMKDEIQTFPKITLHGSYANEQHDVSEVLAFEIEPSFSRINIKSSKNVSIVLYFILVSDV